MLPFVLMLIALILFILATFPPAAASRYNLIAAGLAFAAGSFLVSLWP